MNSISATLRTQYNDLIELYDTAKEADNGSLMERLAKASSTLAKQVIEHEKHEQESITRRDAKKLATIIGDEVGKAIMKYVADKDTADLIIDLIYEKLTDMSQDKTLLET